MENPFTLFGFAPTFEINEQQLASTFRNLQRVVHPDRYANSSDQERRSAVERAAAVNDAYQLLRNPLRRARYLLSLRGVETQEEGNTVMDSEFLTEQMELRERLAEVHEVNDPENILMEMKDTLQKRRSILLIELAECLRIDTQESLIKAAEIVRRLRFFDRLVEETTLLEERYLDSMFS
ncbi:Co-chaperone protein HscB homolog [Gammaproteobacteria bacterium]